MSDTKKQVAVGATDQLAALALAHVAGPLAVGLVPVAHLLAERSFDKLLRSDQKRAKRLFARMIEADETPQEFADHLNGRIMDEDPAVIAALRTLLFASLDAVSLGAIEPIALIGRQYLRDTCPAWLARGWIRLITELTELELAGLRQIVDVGRGVMTRLSGMGMSPTFELTIDRGDQVIPRQPPSFFAPTAHPSAGALAKGYADRLLELFTRNDLTTMLRSEPAGPTQLSRREQERFAFRGDAFDVIAVALPPR